MAIRRFFDQNVVIQRLSTVSGNKKALQTTATVAGHIQSLDIEARQALGILEEKAWKAWFAVDAPIKEGDQLTDENGVRYSVREIVTKAYGINQHREVILEEFNA